MAIPTTQRPLRRPMQRAELNAEQGRGWYAVAARVGLVAKGASFAVVGVLALKLALGDGGTATSRQGALQQLAGTTFGEALLIALAVGFAAYALWRFMQAWVDDKWTKRIGYAGRGLIYAGLTYSTAEILLGYGKQQSQNGKAHKTTAVVLDWPGGKWIVTAAGAVVIGVALWNLYRGLSRKFEDKWRGHSTWGSRAGVVGHVARFVVFGLIGWFVIKAALDYSPKDAIGLDGALQKLAHASYGGYLLGLTAAGLVAYAVYCFVDARYRDVSA
jgi:hypothetical protein